MSVTAYFPTLLQAATKQLQAANTQAEEADAELEELQAKVAGMRELCVQTKADEEAIVKVRAATWKMTLA